MAIVAPCQQRARKPPYRCGWRAQMAPIVAPAKPPTARRIRRPGCFDRRWGSAALAAFSAPACSLLEHPREPVLLRAAVHEAMLQRARHVDDQQAQQREGQHPMQIEERLEPRVILG